MREIKFRAFDKIEGKMWIPIIDQDGMPCAKHPISCHLVRMDGELLDPVMQYTGRQYEDGQDIYEGDILKCGNGHIGVVEWEEHDCCFNVSGYYDSSNDYPTMAFMEGGPFKKLGDIYNNPELLGE